MVLPFWVGGKRDDTRSGCQNVSAVGEVKTNFQAAFWVDKNKVRELSPLNKQQIV